MISAELIADYRSIEKPFSLVERHAHCGGTDYATICRLSDEHARLLASEGISWLYGEPDWQKHHDKIALLQAEKAKAEAEERIAALKSSGTAPSLDKERGKRSTYKPEVECGSIEAKGGGCHGQDQKT